MSNSNLKWAIIGGGNGGQSAAGHLSIMGFNVRLYDVNPETVKRLNELGGIEVDGQVKGFGKIEFATLDMDKAIKGADIIMVIAPALVHRIIAMQMAPYLEDHQIIFIHPGATGGALEFRAVLDDQKCTADVLVSEAMSLIYACRSTEVGKASIFGIKDTLMISALPACRTNEVLEKIQMAYPMMFAGKNVLQTSLENLNSVVHPGPTLLNTSMIESGRDWKYYWDGITPSIGKFAISIDKERIEIGKSLGIELTDIKTWYRRLYKAEGESLSELVKSTAAYAGIKGQTSVQTRYVLEDIPMGLVPMVALAKVLDVNVACMETVITLGEQVLDVDLHKNGRTLKKIGLDGMNKKQIMSYIETGVKQ